MENKEDSFFPNFDPTNDLSQAGKQRRMKRGLGAKPLLESEIKDAQKKARSAMEAARLLGVSYNTYKKYARKYGIFEYLKNPHGTGIRKGYNIKRGKYSLDDIIAGKYPDYPVWKLKSRLLLNGYMLEKCNCCGFEEKRVTYMSATDKEALDAFQYCCKLEGIIPALEPAHALAVLKKIAKNYSSDKVIVMNMCGRGDKDIFTIADELKIKI